MAEASTGTLDLSGRIQQKRIQVNHYLAQTKPTKRRLLNSSIIGGSLSALLTAGPALGGQPFAAWLSGAFGLNSPSWQILCGAAAACSLVATISLQLLKSNKLEENLAKAQICSAKLEILEIGLSAGQMDDKQALSEYIRCVEGTDFLQGEEG
ncbi:MAG TPA: hypothetical protein VN030_04005 [Cellvibrio sp.]|nr:hypothetical protein [Cellvibrio sp.]